MCAARFDAEYESIQNVKRLCAFRSKEVRNQSELPRCINRQQSQHMLLKISVYDSRYNSAHALDETQPQQLPCLGALMQSCCSSMKLPMVV